MEPGEISNIVARLHGVTHRYGNTVALGGIDLQIPGGCMVGLFGPDGVGKSTLLGLIAGARKLQTGSLEVLGGDMRSRRFRAQVAPRVAYMPQGLGGNLYATLSVFENVDFFARLFGQDRKEREWRIKELLDGTGLLGFKDRPASKLSGGMKQKLGLCCALIHDPELLVLDEPTTGVDPLSRRQFWELIARIRARRRSMSVVVATAYMEEAERFDWLAALDGGQVLATGAPAELKSRTGSDSLEETFIQLLPEASCRGHRKLVIPKREARDLEAAIEAEGLTKRFGDFTAVDHASFRIERGEIFGFLGSNGCGKTTTMKMLTGLLPVSGGEARLFGHVLDARDLETRNRVGYMSQSFSLYRELTVRQNLELHARLFHLPTDEIPGRVNDMVERFGRPAEIAVWIDGAMPFRGSTIKGYIEGLHYQYLRDLSLRESGVEPNLIPAAVELRYRYNQDFRSLDAMVPAVIPMLLIFIPAILMAVGVVREKELGSITNLYVTPDIQNIVAGEVNEFMRQYRAGEELPITRRALDAAAGVISDSGHHSAATAFGRGDTARKHARADPDDHASGADHPLHKPGAGGALSRRRHRCGVAAACRHRRNRRGLFYHRPGAFSQSDYARVEKPDRSGCHEKARSQNGGLPHAAGPDYSRMKAVEGRVLQSEATGLFFGATCELTF